MAAFFLFKKNSSHNIQRALSVFQEKGLSPPQQVDAGEFTLCHYKKITLAESVSAQLNGHQLFVCGTLVYKNGSFKNSVRLLLQDLVNNTTDHSQLLGNFCFIYISGGNIELYSDGLGIQNIYYTADKEILSSSFLATACCSLPALSINRNAATESLCTGSLIGPETLLNGIFRMEPHAIPDIPGISIQFIKKPQIDFSIKRSFNEELEHQLNILSGYFGSFKPLADECTADSGITGGHDSRLIMALAQKYWNHVNYHSHYRKVKDDELIVAEEVCKTANVPLKQVFVKHPLDMSNEEFEKVMHEGFRFYDGHIKMHAYWTEEYNNRLYRQEILGDAKFAVSGIGGEQYRNMEGMYLIKWNYHDFIRYGVLLNFCGPAFFNASKEALMVNHLSEKISLKLGIDKHMKKMDMLTLKRYLNEVFIPARLGMRNNAENTLSFFTSPFVDAQVSVHAYSAIPHLGIAYHFQEKMITKLDPKLAAVRSVYGFNFKDGEPFKIKLKQLLQNVIPYPVLQSRIDKHRKNNDNSLLLKLQLKHPACIDYVERVKQLHLPVDIEVLLRRADLMPLVLNLGFFLKKLNIQN